MVDDIFDAEQLLRNRRSVHFLLSTIPEMCLCIPVGHVHGSTKTG